VLPVNDVAQEVMTPEEAARWFRRSPSWLRQQKDLIRIKGQHGQPLFHIRACRAYLLGKMCRLDAENIRRVQIDALAADCGLPSPLPGDGGLAAASGSPARNRQPKDSAA
jgi:hypothetical protein